MVSTFGCQSSASVRSLIGGRASGVDGNDRYRSVPSRPTTASAPSWWMSSVGRRSRRPDADESCIHPDRADRPHLAVGASLGTQESVERPVGVGDDIEGEFKVRPVGGEPLRGGEGDDRDVGVAELVEVIAHGDHVFLARQSSKVPVQHQHEWSPTHLAGAPRPTLVIDELDIRKRVADLKGHGITQVTPRRSADLSIASTSRSIEPSQVSRSAGPSSTTWPASVSATTTGACPAAALRIASG